MAEVTVVALLAFAAGGTACILPFPPLSVPPGWYTAASPSRFIRAGPRIGQWLGGGRSMAWAKKIHTYWQLATAIVA